MTFLEFIRKNSILVLIVIAVVGLGLVMMDYSGKGSYFSRDFYIQVNGTSYSYQEAVALGENGQQYIQSLYSATMEKLSEDMSAPQGEQGFSEAQMARIQRAAQHRALLENVMRQWSNGGRKEGWRYIALNRAILHEEAHKLGLYPSKDQIDAYLKSMPAFCKADGSFDHELYRRLTGQRDGMSNNAMENDFRTFVADLMVWESLSSILTNEIAFHPQTAFDVMNIIDQQVSGMTAWLPAMQAPAEPTEEELKAYWEEHKDNYRTAERRIISVYTLTPDKDSSIEALMSAADELRHNLAAANGKGFDDKLAAAAANDENDPFTYLNEEGKSHITYALSTLEDVDPALRQEVNHNGQKTTLAQIAFSEVATAPSVEEFQKAEAAGRADDIASITQVRGYVRTDDDKLIFIRVEAIEPPSTLPFEEAKEAALADLKTERNFETLTHAATELQARMEAAENLDAAFALAEEAGAVKESFGPISTRIFETELPAAMDNTAFIRVPNGKMAPVVITPEGARFSGVTSRTVENSPSRIISVSLERIPLQNAQLQASVLQSWLNNAYTRYEVKLSEHFQVKE